MDVVEHDTGPPPVEDEGAGTDAGTGPADEEMPADPHASGEAEGAEPEELPEEAADGDSDPPEDGSEVRDPLRFNNWMKRSATGAVMTGIAVGLQQALQLPRQEPAFVIEASGEPHDPDRAIDLHFDPDNPADTVAIIRRPRPEPPEGSSPPA